MDVLKVLSLFLAITAISLPALGHQNTFHHDDPHIPRSVTVSNPDIEQVS